MALEWRMGGDEKNPSIFHESSQGVDEEDKDLKKDFPYFFKMR